MAKKSGQNVPKNKSAAVINIESNDITLIVGQMAKGQIHILETLTYPLSIGRDTFNTGKISFEKADKACAIIKNFLQVSLEFGVSAVKVVATSAIREASNKEYVLDQIRLKTGVSVDVIDNHEEKFYIYKLMYSMLDKELKSSAMMVHIGSGNLGISILEKEKIPYIQNISIGSMRLSELFENIQDYSREFHLVVEEYLESFTDSIEKFIPENIQNFIATGSDISVIGDLCDAEKNGQIIYITKESFYKLFDEVKHKSINRIIDDYKITLDQAELLLPAMCMYSNLFSFTQAEFIISPIVSLADAFLAELLIPASFSELNKEFYKSTILSAKFFAKKFQCSEAHYSKAENFALKIFDKIKKIHGLGVRERLLLQTAAILHDIGKFINIKSHYRHSFNIILGLDIIGLSLRDTEIIANIALYHSRFVPNLEHPNYKNLSFEDRVTVSKLTAILRIADSLDRSHEQKFSEIDVKLNEDELLITIQTDRNIELEQWSFCDKGAFFEEVFGIKATLKQKRV